MAQKAKSRKVGTPGRIGHAVNRAPARPKTRERLRTLREDERSLPGAALLTLLIEEGARRGLSTKELVASIKLTVSHFGMLRTGQRSVPRLGDDVLSRMAQFLGLSLVAVMLLAGRLQREDFVAPTSTHARELQSAMRQLQNDPAFAGYVTPKIMALGPEEQFLIVKLYEAARGLKLLSSYTSVSDVVDGVAP